MLSSENKTLLKQHVIELKQKFPDFTCKVKKEKYIVEGLLPFRATYKNKTIEDEYEIKIDIPNDYPTSAPIAIETGAKIPNDFHRNKENDDSLCLGAPHAIIEKFNKNPTLIYFVEQQIIPFLFSYSYYKGHGEMPYGQLSHGGKGILQSYRARLGVLDPIKILGFLSFLASGNIPRREKCICNSGRRFGSCHKKRIRKLQQLQSDDKFYYEYKQVITSLIKQFPKIPKEFILDKFIQEIKNEKK